MQRLFCIAKTFGRHEGRDMAKKPSPRKPGKAKSGPNQAGETAESTARANSSDTTIIRKYANRRLYNTSTASFVTLDDLRQMVIKGEPFVVIDATTNQDITSSLLAQIVADQETHGESMLPNDVLRQIISFYEQGMSESVSTYLQNSMDRFTDNWQQAQQFGDIGRRNMELFQQNLTTMFGQVGGTATQPSEPEISEAPEAGATTADDSDLENELQDQLRAIQEKLDALSRKSK
jgi:polyhydroxyalkanoate synthesis repressor PhaR